MVELGRFGVLLAVAVSAWAVFAALHGARHGRPEAVRSAEGAVKAAALGLTVAAIALVHAFVTRDFSVEYVATYSNRSLSTFYTLAAFWAGHAGSMLLWAWILSLYGVGVIHLNRNRNRELMPYVIAVVAGAIAFFALIVAFPSNPFQRLPFVPADGQGLNPLLQNYGQMIHPVTTYLGYVGFTIPFAFCIAALATGRLNDGWIRSVRHWTLSAWLFLTAGILLGARWAYVELGWGGYWGWDPVENASLLPWLTGTAYLHSVMIQERKGMLKIWNVALATATFTLVIFGAFITRSGVVESVHSFGESGIGPFLVGGLIASVLLSGALIVRRLPELRSKAVMESALSREASFLANNLLFVGMAFAVFWGTVFPLVAEAVRGKKVSVGPPFFEQVVGPIGIGLLALLGVCPLIAWRKASARRLGRNLVGPAAAAAVALVVTVLVAGNRRGVIAVVVLATFVTFTIVEEFRRGAGARRRKLAETWGTAVSRLVARNPRRYGGHIVHLGVVVMILGITLHMAFKTEYRQTLRIGETARVGRYELTLQDIKTDQTSVKFGTIGIFSVRQGGKDAGVIRSERAMWTNQDQPVSEVGIRSSPREDLYVILESADITSGVISARFFVNPAVFWIWVGATTVLAGGMIVAWPRRRGRKEEVSRAVAAVEEPVAV